jgi:sugar phosphate isomerase/epimerase
MKRTLGLNADCIRGGFTYGNIIKLKEAGFDGFFVCATQAGVSKYKDISESVGLNFEFIHAPFAGINTMWEEGDGYQRIFNSMKVTIETAASVGVPVVVLHLSSGWEPPAVSEIGFKRYDQLVSIAKQKNVKIAFENLRNVENVRAIMERYKDESAVGYCYDAGHEHCYTPGVDWIKIFGDKLICTHIHDNMGYDPDIDPDFHYLPFDGTIDYADMIRRLDEVGYTGTLTLEVFNTTRPEYTEWSKDRFFNECIERAKRIAEL